MTKKEAKSTLNYLFIIFIFATLVNFILSKIINRYIEFPETFFETYLFGAIIFGVFMCILITLAFSNDNPLGVFRVWMGFFPLYIYVHFMFMQIIFMYIGLFNINEKLSLFIIAISPFESMLISAFVQLFFLRRIESLNYVYPNELRDILPKGGEIC